MITRAQRHQLEREERANRLGACIASCTSRLVIDDAAAAKQQQDEREPAERAERIRRRDWLDRAGVQLERPMLRSIVMHNGGDLKQTTSMIAVKAWHGTGLSEKPWLILAGISGCSKSVSAGWKLANGPESHAWVNVEDAVRVFAGYFGAAAERQEVIRRCKFLVLDDIGTKTEDPKEAARQQALLLELMKARVALPTLVTTNLERSVWLTRFPDTRLHSRLKSQCEFVHDRGPDLRGVK